MRRFVRAACAGGVLLLCTACGMHAPPRAIAGEGAPRDSLSTYIEKVRRLSVGAAPRRRDTLATVEGKNAELHAALQALDAGATAARHLRVADAYRAAGILDLAYDHYAAARGLDSHDAAAYDGLARTWRDWGAPDLGLSDVSRALYYAPRSPVVYNTLGTLLDALGQRKEARRAFERAVALDPQAAYAWTNLCYQAFQAGEFGAAAAHCERAVALDPGLTAARNNLALVHAASGDLRRAEVDLSGIGDQAAQQFNMGIVLSAARRYPEAARAFDAAAQLRPGWGLAAERARQARRLAPTGAGAAKSSSGQ